MAEKNWLIRTKNRQILGPATKEKVIELLEKGSLAQEDELACGNGYWFWIREKDLIDKYLYGDLPQSFNPISEAQDVLTAKSSADGITASMTAEPVKKAEPVAAEQPEGDVLPGSDDLAYPDEEDLGYPDMGEPAVEASAPSIEEERPTPSVKEVSSKPGPELELSSEPTQGEDNTLYPSEADLAYPSLASEAISEDPDSTAEIDSATLEQAKENLEDITDPNIPIAELEEVQVTEDDEDPSFDSEESVEEEVYEDEVEEEEYEEEEEEEYEEEEVKPRKKRKKVVQARGGNDRYLIYIGALLLIIIGIIIYYFKVIINKPIPYVGISSVQAQTVSTLGKKKA